MKVFAHRGYSGKYPENTLPAFRAAAELAVDGVEFDVHLTKDGEAVVIHDEKLRRTTTGKGFVKDHTLAELKTLDAGSWFSEEWAGTEIPTLAEVLDVFHDTHHTLNIELKTDVFPYEGLLAEVIRLVARAELSERVILSSFNHEDIAWATRNTSLTAALLTSQVLVNAYDYGRGVGTTRLHVSLPGAFRSMTSEALRKGSVVYVYTVNDGQHLDGLKQAGVHGIFTDYPEKMQELLAGQAE